MKSGSPACRVRTYRPVGGSFGDMMRVSAITEMSRTTWRAERVARPETRVRPRNTRLSRPKSRNRMTRNGDASRDSKSGFNVRATAQHATRKSRGGVRLRETLSAPRAIHLSSRASTTWRVAARRSSALSPRVSCRPRLSRRASPWLHLPPRSAVAPAARARFAPPLPARPPPPLTPRPTFRPPSAS